MSDRAKSARLHACNVVVPGPAQTQLWRFSVGAEDVTLDREQNADNTTPLPAPLVAKDWRSLWQHKLNLAWLPADQVFVRVTHLPTNDPAEVPAMIELQLEKLSPVPVAQIVWSFELLPAGPEPLQTAVVILAARSYVEAFLGQLEQQGYLADRLELPALHQLLTTKADGDGVWVFPGRSDGRTHCLAAWWYGGVLRHVNLIHLPATEDWPKVLADELSKTAWAGEAEGWFVEPLRCRLVAETAVAAVWEAALSQWTGSTVSVAAALPPAQLAALNVRRLARHECQANLLPADYTARYRQMFIDRLWMRGLGAAVAVYLVGVLIYFGALQVLEYQQRQVETELAGLTTSYNNALQLKARVQVLQEQVNLKYAALDAWKAITESLPTELTLTRINFQRGQKLSIAGIGAGDQAAKVTDYVEALTKVRANNTNLFTKVSVQNTAIRPGTLGPQTTTWNIECELSRQEI